jgi:PKD repeat protein
VGTSTATAPSATWTSQALNYSGGSYAFDGTTTACDGTFYFDFSDLAAANSGAARWFTGIYDNAIGGVAGLKAFNLYTVTTNGDVIAASASGMPLTADRSQVYAYVDYSLNSGNQIPMAKISAGVISGSVPVSVSFDGSSSNDPDGSIVSYSWNLGDGFTGSGQSVSHTYSAPGNYTVTLTVTDDARATGTASLSLSFNDPNALVAPSGLKAVGGKSKATLTWVRNPNNGTGFYIEKGSKTRNGVSYSRIATITGDVSTYTDNTGSGTYYYRIQAYNSNTGASSAYSNAVSVRVK